MKSDREPLFTPHFKVTMAVLAVIAAVEFATILYLAS